MNQTWQHNAADCPGIGNENRHVNFAPFVVNLLRVCVST